MFTVLIGGLLCYVLRVGFDLRARISVFRICVFASYVWFCLRDEFGVFVFAVCICVCFDYFVCLL